MEDFIHVNTCIRFGMIEGEDISYEVIKSAVSERKI